MKLHKYDDDALVKRLSELSAKATPGPWRDPPTPTRIVYQGVQGPLMSYLTGDGESVEGMKVSLGSERVADHEFVAALVNAWRDGRLYCVMGEYVPPSTRTREK